MPQKYDEPEPCLNFCHVEGYLNEACKLKKKKYNSDYLFQIFYTKKWMTVVNPFFLRLRTPKAI